MTNNPCSSVASLAIRIADLGNPQDAADIVYLLDAYSRHPFGNNAPLRDEIREKLIPAMREHPTTRVFIASGDGKPLGLAVCFTGFSTFAAKQLVNVHDLSVVAEARGKGVGRALLRAVEEDARSRGYCKVTLEVVEENDHARGLYESEGFRQATYAEGGGALFYSKPLG